MAEQYGKHIKESETALCPAGDGFHTFGNAVLNPDGLTETLTDTEHGTGHKLTRHAWVTAPISESTRFD